MQNNKKNLLIYIFLMASLCISGCNTVKGFGKDVSKTGKEIQRATR